MAHPLNFKVKTGLHTGECDVRGEKYSNFAVNLAQKIAEESDLVAGLGIVFEEHGVKSFADPHGEWRLFSIKK